MYIQYTDVYCIYILIDTVGSERAEISTLDIHEKASLLRHAHTFTHKMIINVRTCKGYMYIMCIYIYHDMPMSY